MKQSRRGISAVSMVSLFNLAIRSWSVVTYDKLVDSLSVIDVLFAVIISVGIFYYLLCYYYICINIGAFNSLRIRNAFPFCSKDRYSDWQWFQWRVDIVHSPRFFYHNKKKIKIFSPYKYIFTYVSCILLGIYKYVFIKWKNSIQFRFYLVLIFSPLLTMVLIMWLNFLTSCKSEY